MLRDWLIRLRERVLSLAARAGKRLDDHAEKRTGEWGSKLEYKRRYTNPDEAKRHRAPPDEKI